jgi:predicted Zn-dependent peptidase
MADIALRPTFPPPELERQKIERLTTLLQWRDEPRALASITFNRALFGDNHPYGRPSIGSEASIRALTVDDLRKFHATYFRPNNATLVVVGDVTPATILPRLEKAFGSWKAGAVTAPDVTAAAQVKGREIILVDKPGAAQTEIRIGRIGAARLSPDYHTLIVLNTILGGSFTSRLNTNLREVHGYSYGAGSRFDFRPVPGAFVASSAVQTAVTDSALAEIMKELRVIRTPASEQELGRARNYVALGYPGDFQTVGQLAGQLGGLVTYNLPENTFNRYIGNILAVGAEEVRQAAVRHIDPENIAIVLVGDRKQIEADVAALNLGKIRNLTVEDVLGKPPVVGGGP